MTYKGWENFDASKHQAKVHGQTGPTLILSGAVSYPGNSVILAPKPSKYRSKKCEIDGLTFDSLKEGRRYVALKHMQMSGQIFGLEVQYKLPCFVKGQTICVYRCDFRYRTAASVDSGYTYEDVKGRKMRDAVFVIKRKLVSALYDITILET